MITPKKKICKGCQTEQYIWSKGYCKQCASKNYNKVNKVSIKQAETNKILHTIYSVMDVKPDKKCFFCGSKNNITHCHLVRRSYSQKLIVHPLNIVHACLDCHNTYDNDITERVLLNNYDKALERIKMLDCDYYNRMINL